MHTPDDPRDNREPTEVAAVLEGGGEMGQLMRSLDWASTPVGPVETWPQSLRTVLGILLTSEHPMFVWWGDELVQFYNDGYRPILGSTKHPAAMGQRGRECWREIWDVIAPMIEAVLAGGSTYTKDGLLLLDRHGFLEECYFNYAYSPIRGESGDVAGIFVACNETSGRVIGERRLTILGDLGAKASEAKSPRGACRAAAAVLSEVKSDVPFALLYLVDDDGSKAVLTELIGLPPGHATAPPSIPLDRDHDALWPLQRSFEEGVEVAIAEALPCGAWPEPCSRALVLPLESTTKGAPHGFLVGGFSPRLIVDDAYRGFLRLVAGHVASAIRSGRAYAEERRRAEELAELDRAKSAFFSNVSHEFRTPLTLMLGPVEDSLADTEHPLDPEQRVRIERVRRNGIRLQKLVNALLDFSRLGAGKMQPQLEPVDLPALTTHLATTFDSLMSSAGLELVVDCPALPEPIWVDRSMWEKVVLNLLSNAFKFTLAGKVTVRLQRREDRVELEVTDTGTGIAEDEQPRIFERFHRVEGATGRSGEGSGIGLSLVRELVRLHGGEVSVESTMGVGSRFTVALPTDNRPPHGVPAREPRASLELQARAFVQEAQEWSARDDDRRLAVPALEALPHEEPRGLVLVADDNADMREYIAHILESRFDVVSVADGQAALEAARAHLPDVVLSDIMMPGLDGFGLVGELAADARTAQIPVILISARAGEEATVEGLRAGVADYVVKPFGARELVARVEVVAKAAQARQEKARLLREVEAARARLHNLFENAPAFVCTLRGPRHVYEMFNLPYQRLVGLERPLEGLPVAEALPEVVAQGFIALLDTVYRTGEPYFGSEVPVSLARQPTSPPEQAYVSFIYQPTRDGQGAIDGIDVFGFEVTEHVEARRRAERLSEELRAADQRKDEFLAMLAHELRNPMAAISLALTMLEQSDGDRHAAARYRATARRQMSHLVRLVDDLLDVSRITRGKVDLRKEGVNLGSIVEHAVGVMRPAVEARELELSVTLSPALRLYADPTRLEQVVVNLLTNAVKYTAPGGAIAVCLEREMEGGEAMARLSVRDNGRGMPRDMLGSVFDMFVQVRPTLDRKTGGLGLGLTLVKGLVDLHGGRVEARSDGPGKGSELVVWLPLSKGAPRDATVRQEQAPRAAPSGKRIVVVEDSDDLRATFEAYLRGLGHEVTAAANGPEGLAISLELCPDVALVDVGLPGMDGYELARRIRAAPGGEKLFLVALTGYGGIEAKGKAASAGFDVHLTKPVDLRKLDEVLSRSTDVPQRAG